MKHQDINELIRKAEALDRLLFIGRVTEEEVLQLSDFTGTLEATIKTELSHLGEPTFVNPITGKAAASVYAIFIALDYNFTLHWSKMCRTFTKEGGVSVFKRSDLKKSSSSWPTICCDLDQFERLVTILQPRKAPKVIAAFKEDKGLSDK